MDDLLLDELGRALVRFERLGPLLDDLIVPRQACAGENAGLAPVVPSSRPPVSVPMVDLKSETERLVGWWCGQLAAACPEVGGAPVDRSVVARAGWLREHLEFFELMPWAELAAQDLVAQSRWVGDVVDPPVPAGAPGPLEVGPVREIASWCLHLGVLVTERTIRRWVADGEITSGMAPDGRMLVELAAVLERCRSMRGSSSSQAV